MPKIALSTTKANRRAGARHGNTVVYTKPNGTSVTAKVVGGSGNTLNLRLPHHPQANRELTNVARRTTLTQTGVWH